MSHEVNEIICGVIAGIICEVIKAIWLSLGTSRNRGSVRASLLNFNTPCFIILLAVSS